MEVLYGVLDTIRVTTNMTWTLRFYDRDGVEIGYIQKPDRGTYNWEVTHPDPEWDDFKNTLRWYHSLKDQGDYSDLENPGVWRMDHGPMRYQTEPEEHLQLVRERLDHPEVAEAVLRDE
jgi:hypothetical protein